MMKWAMSMAIVANLFMTGCSDDTSCSSDSDCFAGEYCASGDCQAGPRPTENNANNLNNVNNLNNGNNQNNVGGSNNNVNGSNNSNNTNNVNGSNNSNNTNNVNNSNNQTNGACVVDLFGNTCDDDRWEDNDRANDEELATDQSAWCENGVLMTPLQTFEGTLCPGDAGDFFRMQIDNRTPHQCLADTFTVRITVEIDETCSAENLQVQPYTFFNDPTLSSLCATDPDVRCEIQQDGQKYVINWLWSTEQLPDPRLMIAPTREDIELNYTVTVEIIQ